MAGIDKWMVFGGSWGSTLSLAYAQTHPDRVTELVLRGIFLFRQSEVDWLYKYGASELYPEGWQDFIGLLQDSERDQVVEAYHRRLTSGDDAVRLAAAKAWSTWEGLIVTLLPDPEMLEEFTEDNHAIAIARIENHYMRNHGWLDDDQLLENAHKLQGIPGVIVQGRHDCCTPPQRGMGFETGLARGRTGDRPRRRPSFHRARHYRRAGPRDRPFRSLNKIFRSHWN